jgi:phosphoribosylamine---glycine ligase
MNILFISNDLIGGNLAYLLKKEGHNVKLFIEDSGRHENFHNMVIKTYHWRKELSWVGKDGLIVFDDVGYGEIQDDLRNQGYTVFGGNKASDKIEQDRAHGQELFKKYGLKTVPSKDFSEIKNAIAYVNKNPKAWVIKQNNHHYSKVLNYVGEFEDGRDIIGMLKNYSQNKKVSSEKISLQQKIIGVEIGIGRYFNGNDWVGPIEFNIEYTRFFPGDIGPLTSEMGTLAWYSSNENNKLYKETLEKIKPYLKKINFRGDFEINCIVNESGVYPLEATPRLGSPIIHLHSEIHTSPWGEFLYAIARGEKYDLKWKKGYGMVVLVAVPPFPYTEKSQKNLLYGSYIYFDKVEEENKKHIHFEEVSYNINKKRYYISDTRGYILYVTGVSPSLKKTQEKVYNIINNIYIPKMMYRNDIGDSFLKTDKAKLLKWGYLD